MVVQVWPGTDALPEVEKWPVSGRRALYTSDWVSLDLLAVQPPGAPAYEHHVVDVPYNSVVVVVHHTEHGVLMLYRHRFITDTTGLEVPAGGIEPGETPLEAAHREVLEETGWELGDAQLMLSANVSDGLTGQRFHYVYGPATREIAEPVDTHEATALYWVPTGQLDNLIANGSVPGSPSVLALLYADHLGHLRDSPPT